MDVRLCFVDGVGLSYAFGTSLLCLTAAFMCDTGFAQCVSFGVAFLVHGTCALCLIVVLLSVGFEAGVGFPFVVLLFFCSFMLVVCRYCSPVSELELCLVGV